MRQRAINIIDFEASSLDLQKSYPIQVGVALDDGTTYSAYIKPEESWTDWNPKSQEVHGIPRHVLRDCGKDVKTVAQELCEFIGEETVYCDGGVYDFHWLSVLFHHAKVHNTINVELVRFILPSDLRYKYHPLKEETAKTMDLKEHDAGNDALIIQSTVKQILQLEAEYHQMIFGDDE
jgi:hypothetical protein